MKNSHLPNLRLPPLLKHKLVSWRYILNWKTMLVSNNRLTTSTNRYWLSFFFLRLKISFYNIWLYSKALLNWYVPQNWLLVCWCVLRSRLGYPSNKLDAVSMFNALISFLEFVTMVFKPCVSHHFVYSYNLIKSGFKSCFITKIIDLTSSPLLLCIFIV